MKSPDISIVIPVHNEEGNIGKLYLKLIEVLKGRRYEILFIDDGSTDGTYQKIMNIRKKDSSVKPVRFKRNFGKSAALAAGLKSAAANIVITMDGDLQDDPSDIPKLLEKINEGYDMVVGWKQKKYSVFSPKFLASRIFNVLTKFLTGIKLHDFDCPFKALRKDVAKSLNVYGELHRYIPVLADQEGFKIGEVKIKNLPRTHGKSKFNYTRLVRGFLDLITVLFLTRFLKRPLHFFGSIGLLLSLLGFTIGVLLVIRKFIFGIVIKDNDIIIFTVTLIILGAQFISIGLIGEMLANINQKINGEK